MSGPEPWGDVRRFLSAPQGEEDEPRPDWPIGEIAVSRGYLTEAQLEAALEEQRAKSPHALLGRILVDRRFITSAQLLRLLAFQRRPAAGERPPLPAGVSIGRYSLVETLGRGDRSVVYRGVDPSGIPSALKVLKPDPEDQAEAARLRRAAERLAELRVAGVVRVREAGMTSPPTGPARPYFVMDLLPGETLETILAAGRTSRGDLLRILEETARILAAAADAGVLHGGLKPSNVFVERGARVLVSDFGVSRRPWTGAGGDPESLPRQRYRAPEQLRQALPPGAAADVFALGALLYEVLTGRPAFPAAEPEALFDSILEARFEPVRRWSPTVEPAIESVCMKALQKEPLRRYPDAAAFAGDLERFRLGKPVIAEPWSPPRKPQGQRTR